MTLDGDPEHAGVQYRPANEVDAQADRLRLSQGEGQCHKDLDYPWVGETYMLDGKKYSVVDLNHPGNPKKTRFSAYRDYGRFGAFPVATIKKGESLNLDYRFLIVDGEMPPAELNPEMVGRICPCGAAQSRAGSERDPGRTAGASRRQGRKSSRQNREEKRQGEGQKGTEGQKEQKQGT